jgi:hypothetical protein
MFKRAHQFDLAIVSPDALEHTCKEAKHSTPGTDGWTPADWAKLPKLAFSWLATLLDCIEAGKPWPKDLLHAKAAYMEKDPEATLDPMSYRVLQILPVLYRRWASMRLRDLHPWIEEWMLEAMFAGIPGQGAHDGAYAAALIMERCRVSGMPFTGGAVDICKCFDQMVRPLKNDILRQAGCPEKVIIAYQAI